MQVLGVVCQLASKAHGRPGTWGSLAGMPFRPQGRLPEAREGGKDSFLSSSFV